MLIHLNVQIYTYFKKHDWYFFVFIKKNWVIFVLFWMFEEIIHTCTVHVNVVIHFVLVCFFLEWKQICAGFFFFYCLCIHVLSLEIQLSRGEGLDSITQFNPATFLYLSQARTWISNIIFRLFFLPFLFTELRWEVIVHFVDIGGIVDHHSRV